MGSTSASSIQKSFEYDVFLSFRGDDTRKNFVGHLYQALHQKGINTYKDDVRIEKGEKISDQLVRSIEESKFHIIVFSKNYASSSWCLDELLKIMECHKTKEQTAYPVFYDVEPTDVRHQSGTFGKAFDKHEKKEAAERWRAALTKAGNLAGWALMTTFNGDEAKCIQNIVEDISSKLHVIISNFKEKLVGMETRVKKVVSSLELESADVRMIGIKGMRGIGKTTLARAIFYDESIRFDGKSFIDNVREVSKVSGLNELQKQILSDVLNDKDIVVKSVFDGEGLMKSRMRNRKVLIVLDDVDNIEQLKALAGKTTWFKPGSRIIITTTDKHLLVEHEVHGKDIHDVDLLTREEAIRLFHRCAFKRGIPIQGYEVLTGKVIKYAAGLPLTIKVLGSFLYGRTKHQWKKTFKRLKRIPLKETLEKLELSYNDLEEEYQEIFLDVACILKGERKDDAIRILKSYRFDAELGLTVLEERSLITVSATGHLGLHDSLEEMGWNIVRRMGRYNPSRYSRLWIKEEIEDILTKGTGTEETKSIKLQNSQLSPDVIMKGLANMTELNLLYVDNGYQTDVCTSPSSYNYANLPNALRCVYWRGYPLSCLPKTFQAKELVNLEMRGSSVSELWEQGERKELNKLRFLDLKSPKLRTFDLGMTRRLKTLDLRGCKEFVELNMPDELRELKFLVLSGSKLSTLNLELTPNLEGLDLEDCKEFVELHMPNGPLKLRFLNLSGYKVSNLWLTPHLEKFERLEELTLSITEITHLPDSICMLKHLKSLKLKSCRILKQLPEDLDKLECLEELYLIDCRSLRDIPKNICKMKCLKSLHLPYIGVEKLPEKLGGLKSLRELNIEGARISDLPQSILQLKGLCIVWSRGQLESCGFESFTKISEYTASCYV